MNKERGMERVTSEKGELKEQGSERNDEFKVNDRGPSSLRNKRVQMELDDMSTILSRNVNQRKMKYYLVTKNGDKDVTVEES